MKAKNTHQCFFALTFILLSVLLLIPRLILAGVDTRAGNYKLTLTTQPRIIPVGAAKIVFEIKDASGKPIENLDVRAIARMPGMFMGEREGRANPVPRQPGTYTMQASFPMGGSYEIATKISGPLGDSSVSIPVQTGQDTGGEIQKGFSWMTLIPWAIGIALLIFVIYRIRRTGQRLNWHSVLNRSTMVTLLTLTIMFVVALYAVRNWRREGAMTPIEAQVMEMNTPPPPGVTAVRLAIVKRGPIVETVRYAGQALGFVEQDVNPRVTGTIVRMPFYVGDRVKKGQVLAQLDTSQLDPQLAEKLAMTNMALQGVGVATTEYQAALQEVVEARAELAVKQSLIEEAEAMLTAAGQEKEAIESEVLAAEAEAKFRVEELRRARELYEKNAISRSELQQTEAEAASAQSKVRAAQASVRKAEAMIRAAQKKVQQAQAEVRSAKAVIQARQAAAEAKRKNIAKERAGIAQARAGYQSAAAQRSYSVLKAEVNGVITQRLIGPGVLVNPGQTVLKVAQVSPIRLQANVAESDLARVRVGSSVTIMSRDDKGMPIKAHVTSLSPALDPQTRTGFVEVVWPNTNNRFLPGHFITMQIELGSSQKALIVPIEVVQHQPAAEEIKKTYVWVASPTVDKGLFRVTRVEVQVGISDGKNVQILSGLREGQQVVTTGASSLSEGSTVSSSTEEIKAEGPIIEIIANGYRPDTVTAERGKPITITFVRIAEEGCGTEIVFPDLKINKPLPLNKPVEVTITPTKSGEIRFTCGMDMYRGKVIVP